jgi:DNA-binding NarL/FixJ family response regulator
MINSMHKFFKIVAAILLTAYALTALAAPGTSSWNAMLKDRLKNPQNYWGGPEMRPSIEELSDGPSRSKHIALRGGKTNAEIAADLRIVVLWLRQPEL